MLQPLILGVPHVKPDPLHPAPIWPFQTVAEQVLVHLPAFTSEVRDCHPMAATTPPAEDAGELRVARTWTNVRKSRSVRAPLEAVLMPGDTVLADSLGRGWYRVALDGEVLGYAHRSTLAAP